MRFYSPLLLLSFIFVLVFNSNSIGQNYQWSKAINLSDSGQVTACTVSPEGDLYVASYHKKIQSSYNFGLNMSFPYGEMILSKFNTNGEEIWSNVFEGSVGRIFDIELDQNNDLVFNGGFYDSLNLAPQAQYTGEVYYSSSFLAKFDTSGAYIWAKVKETENYLNFVSSSIEVLESMLIEAGRFGDFYSIRKLNSLGDTIATLQYDILVRFVSDMEVNSDGDIYIAGAAFSTGYIDTVPIPDPPNNTTYLNYAARLNSDLHCLWVRSTNYITLDMSPEIELFGNQIALLTNEFPNGGNGSHSYKIKYYNESGNFLHSDSVANYFLHSNGMMSISSLENHLLLTLPQGDSLLRLIRIDTNYLDTVLSTVKCISRDNYPRFRASQNAVYFISSFYSPIAIVNNTDTINNIANVSIYDFSFRQFISRFNLVSCSNNDSSISISQCEPYLAQSGEVWQQSGLYVDHFFNQHGCDSSLHIDLTILQVDTAINQNGYTLNSNAINATFQWIDCSSGMAIDGEIESSFTPSEDGSYALELNQNGCVDTSLCYTILGLFVEDIAKMKLQVYPNPANDIIRIESNMNLQSIVLYDMYGREVWNNNYRDENKIEINLSTFSRGQYLLKSVSGDYIDYKHLVLQ